MTRNKPSRKKVLEHFGFGTELMKKYKVCSSCGNKQKAKNKFCEVCHAALTANTLFDTYRLKGRCCEKCGNVLPNDAGFCPLCGAKQNGKEREEVV